MALNWRESLKSFQSYKIYHIMILSTIAFLLIVFNGFYQMKKEYDNLAERNKIGISKDIEFIILSWLDERINNLENSIKFIDKDIIDGDEEKLKTFIKIFSHQNSYFDTVQILFPKHFWYVNSRKSNDYRENPNYVHQPSQIDPLVSEWFINTKNSKKTTLTYIPKHAFLNESAINICSPILDEEIFQGIMCGVFKAGSIFQKIKNLELPDEAYYFIANSEGKMLTASNSDLTQKQIEENFVSKVNHESSQAQVVEIGKHIVSISKISHFDWYIGIGVDKSKVFDSGLKKIFLHAFILFIGFVFISTIVSGAFEFMRRRANRKQKEYQYLLEHRSRVVEIGKLISGFNHQLRQPINSLSLMLSNILQLSKNKSLTQSALEESILACQKSINLIDKSISLFRNFYRSNRDITEFKVQDTISAVLHIVFTDFVRYNINFVIDEGNKEQILARSFENFVQQIVLVLIQNSKDAILEEEAVQEEVTNKKIIIKIKLEDEKVIIDVMDWGSGVSEKESKTLFSTAKSSKKKQGTGIGLYFAKKLAQERLLGDLELVNKKSPTIFRLTFIKNLEEGRA